MGPIRPKRIVENTQTWHDKIDSLRRMIERNPSSTLDRHLINPEIRACDGEVFVFLPGIVLVYDYHEFMATQRAT